MPAGSGLLPPPVRPSGAQGTLGQPDKNVPTDKPPAGRKAGAPLQWDTPNTYPDAGPVDAPKPPTESSWYGWKSMIGLTPVYALFVGGIVTREYALFIPGGIGALLVTPVAHWTHGNRGRGWASFGLNLGVPLVGSFVAGGYGALVGLGLWNILDIATLHYEQVPVKPASHATTAPSFAVLPMLDQKRAGIMLVGQF